MQYMTIFQINIFICLIIITRCQSENLLDLPINIQRYWKFHLSGNEDPIKSDFYASIQSINDRLGSLDGLVLSSSPDMYLLPNEVVLIRNALSENEQKLLFTSMASSIPQALAPVQVDEALCPNCQCSLHTWKLNETLNESDSKIIQTLGEVMYLKAASFLKVQQATRKKNSIDQSLHAPPIHQSPSFKYVHGVMYGINDTLGPHHDKTWSANSNSKYEWVVSISLGHTAVFKYGMNNDDNEEKTTTEIDLNSGDVLLFNGAYLEHSMPYIHKNKYPMWWYNVDTFSKARLNIQYRVLGEEDFQRQQPNSDVIGSYTPTSVASTSGDSIIQCAKTELSLKEDNESDKCSHTSAKFLLKSNEESVSFGTSWMNRIFDLVQPIHPTNGSTLNRLNVNGFKSMLRKFWPFTLNEQLNNQRLAIMGIRGTDTKIPQDNGLLKKLFYECLFDIQKLSIPIEPNGIVMSFSDSSIIMSLHIAGLLQNPAEFDSTFSSTEITYIKRLVHEAMSLINRTDRELYLCIIQSVSTLAFYKYVDPGYIGGTISSIIGVIWLDPSNKEKWTVEVMAEQIVHEFIHTSLFINELVHTSYSNYDLLEVALVKSAIRQQLRNYDKSFHAAHVATGLVAFLAKAGYTERAKELITNLPSSINDLEIVSIHTGVLSTSGRTLLRALQNFFNEGVRRGGD
ncbi:unnamed protein product [Adineta steineri]|uniref:Alpha-ketoglutarate-dependent dioxygenase AlkB-like domain-containing protein n=1 Tax=Adineta steineri TaxID=433720 RepID=A0A813Y4C9_9BILA|nr:unnamed protein product [Adineta steineri]CAF0967367.1 unnamed protein product [Adineta steineri]CAF1049152.1 unnamed protein product [Adineta steineri]CAF3632647.1 unnamed protein product [Adineta steineri]CAF3795634.1 unnamed protein product [Adineta steineri]